MAKIDRYWLAAKLAPNRGLKARLARHLGVDGGKVSKMLSGVRAITADEALKIMQFFGDLPALTPEDASLLARADRLTVPARKQLSDFADFLLRNEDNLEKEPDREHSTD